jgi:hypothetical protein
LFKRYAQPCVLILEDIHWSPVGVETLKRITTLLHDTPLLILASFRLDERPQLPVDLPMMRLLRLERLERDQIAQLCHAIIGDTREQVQVVELLQRETEGNVYFILEVIRTLAEDAGELFNIGTATLPAQVFSGGMRLVVQRRLAHVPSELRALLDLAAVAGRAVEPAVLALTATAQQLPIPLEQWLTAIANAAVFDVVENQWQFAHDKLREGILNALSAPTKQAYHAEFAMALEQHAGSAADVATLAYHWRAAGQPQREFQFVGQAGRIALRNGAYAEAAQALWRALTLAEQLGTPTSAERLALHQALGEANYGLGELGESRQQLEQALVLGGLPLPPPQVPRQALLRQAARQLWHRIRMPRPPRQPDPILLPLIHACERMVQILYTNNEPFGAIYYSLLGLNLAEVQGYLAEQAQFYANMLLVTSNVGLNNLTKIYIRRALQTAQDSGDLDALSWVYLIHGVYRLGRGELSEAEQLFANNIAFCERVGHLRRLEETQSFYISVFFMRGEWRKGNQLLDELQQFATRQRDPQIQGWVYSSRAQQALRQGEFIQALEHVTQSLAFLERSSETGGNLRLQGLLLRIYLYSGLLQEAQTCADAIMEVIQKVRPTRFGALDAYSAVVEFYLSQWENDPQPTTHERAAQALQQLQRFARVFPLGAPYALLYAGWYAQLVGKPAEAPPLWDKALKLAEARDMPYEQGLVHYYAGRYARDAEREKHLTAALRLLAQVGADWDAQRARVLL